MEKEEFSVALSDYDSALEHYRLSGADEDDRRLADIHFQRARCLELMDRLDEALAAVQDAIAVLERKKAVLKAEGGKDAEQQAVEVDAVLKGLKEKVEDLGEAISEAEATRAAMRGAMEQLGAAMAAAAGGANRTGASGSSGNPASSSPIKDLGVVGRGTKRINLAPTLAPAGDAAVQGDGSAGAQTAKKKRSLDDLMGPSAQGTTTVGFGAQDKDMQPQADNKSAPSFAVPAFLKALADKTQQKDV